MGKVWGPFRLACIASTLAILSACGLWGRPHLPRPTFSPNGEPLVGPQWPASCGDALDAWFDRADTNHDGALTMAEFEADAVRQFNAMDLRHDGKVTAAELSTYRQSVMGNRYASISTPEAAARRRARDEDDSGDRGGGYSGESRRRRDDSSMPAPDSKGTMPADQPDPVMSADTNLDGSVTLDEFRILVHQNFADLDRDHTGSIGKSDVRRLCRGSD
jgi:hypothetical protein